MIGQLFGQLRCLGQLFVQLLGQLLGSYETKCVPAQDRYVPHVSAKSLRLSVRLSVSLSLTCLCRYVCLSLPFRVSA